MLSLFEDGSSFVPFTDRPRLRWLLALAFNTTAWLHERPAVVRYDGSFWLYGAGDVILPKSRNFSFQPFYTNFAGDLINSFMNESREHWFHVYTPKPGDTIIDVGAEVGIDTVVFSQAVGPAGRVIAIEAQPETFAMLRSTCKANSLDNVSAVHVAVSGKPGGVHITADREVVSNHLSDRGEPVAADTLDNLLRAIPRIDLLKMNIEGAEKLALLGMEETLAKTAKIAVACHDFIASRTGNEWFRTRAVVVNHLKRSGFEIIERADDEREYVRDHVHGVRRDAP